MDRGSELDYSGYPREAEDFLVDTKDHAPHNGGANYREAGLRSATGHRSEHNGPWSVEDGVSELHNKVDKPVE